MNSGNVYDQLSNFWDEVTKSWSADAKNKYHNCIFNELMDSAHSVYSNNIDLENMVRACLSNCNLSKEDY